MVARDLFLIEAKELYVPAIGGRMIRATQRVGSSAYEGMLSNEQ